MLSLPSRKYIIPLKKYANYVTNYPKSKKRDK